MAKRAPTEQELDSDSIQLVPGQKFHYVGKNGVPYLRIWVRQFGEDVFPVVSTPDAVSVLPVTCNSEGRIEGAYMLFQLRPETAGVSIKATGSYCNKGEPRVDAALRSLRVKLGISAEERDLIECGEAYGYGHQYNFPVSCYVVKRYHIEKSARLPEDCERRFMTIEEMAKTHKANGFFGDETIHLIATVILRNTVPGVYEW